jgi:hypothetical protein
MKKLVAIKDYIQNLLNYLDILYPNGEPIDPLKECDPHGYPIYKAEVNSFMQLAEA